MLPYKPRHPAFGGKLRQEWVHKQHLLQHQQVNEQRMKFGLSSIPFDSCKFKPPKPTEFYKWGGPVEEAIAEDLLEFSYHVHKEWNPILSNSNCHKKKQNVGKAFQIFKEQFKSCHMGLLHQQIPPRCDHDAFSQLIYSSCFHLLEQAFETFSLSVDSDGSADTYTNVNTHINNVSETSTFTSTANDDNNNDGSGLNQIQTNTINPSTSDEANERRSNPNQTPAPTKPIHPIQSVAFALFSLYTLYHTNPLPLVPVPPSPPHTNNNPNTNDSNYNYDMLPLNITHSDPKVSIHRRWFRAPIRISRRQMSILHQTRDLSLALVSSCTSNSATLSTTCHCPCFIAQDVIELCDRIQAKQHILFDCCEYPGPGTLDGLVASVWCQQDKLSDSIASDSISKFHLNEVVPVDVDANAIPLENTMDWVQRIKTDLDLNELHKSMTHYQNSIVSLSFDTKKQNNNHKNSNKMESLPNFAKRIQHNTNSRGASQFKHRAIERIQQTLMPLLQTYQHNNYSNLEPESNLDQNYHVPTNLNPLPVDTSLPEKLSAPTGWNYVWNRLQTILHACETNQCHLIPYQKEEKRSSSLQLKDNKNSDKTQTSTMGLRAIGTTARILQEKYGTLNAYDLEANQNPPSTAAATSTVVVQTEHDQSNSESQTLNNHNHNNNLNNNVDQHNLPKQDTNIDSDIPQKGENQPTSPSPPTPTYLNEYRIIFPSSLSKLLKENIRRAILSQDPMKEFSKVQFHETTKPATSSNHKHKKRNITRKPHSKNNMGRYKVQPDKDLHHENMYNMDDDGDNENDNHHLYENSELLEEEVMNEMVDDYSVASSVADIGKTALGILLSKVKAVDREKEEEDYSGYDDDDSEDSMYHDDDYNGNDAKESSLALQSNDNESDSLYLTPSVSTKGTHDNGRQALNDLLMEANRTATSTTTKTTATVPPKQVLPTIPAKRTIPYTVKRTRAQSEHLTKPNKRQLSQMEDLSTTKTHDDGSSTGNGGYALNQLLQLGQSSIGNTHSCEKAEEHTKKKARRSTTTSKKRKAPPKQELFIHNRKELFQGPDETQSMADSVVTADTGNGRHALHQLLSKAQDSESSEPEESDTQSIAETTFASADTGNGRLALHRLLNEATPKS